MGIMVSLLEWLCDLEEKFLLCDFFVVVLFVKGVLSVDEIFVGIGDFLFL